MTKTFRVSGDVKLIDDASGVTVDILRKALSLSETYTELQHSVIELAISATDVSINFGGVTNGLFVVIIPTYNALGAQYITAKVNGGSENIRMGKMMALGGKTTNSITSLSLSNPDATYTVSVEVFIVG